MRIDPRIVATEHEEVREGAPAALTTSSTTDSASQDVQIAFAG
jgi:hypothetical protein